MTLDGLRYYLRDPRRWYAYFGNRGLLNWMSDEAYLKLAFRMNMNQKLDLKNPKTFNEKLQWLKLYDRKPEYTRMVDKYEAKQYVAERIGEEYIVPTLGVWDRFDDIDFDSLPDQFVLKTTHDSGGLVICRDKSKLDVATVKKTLERCLKRNYYYASREWPYKNVKPRILAEAYMEDPQQPNGLRDYKFFCFSGEPRFLYISEGLEDHSTASISFLEMDWRFAPFRRSDYKPFSRLPEKPQHYDEMVQLARKLAGDMAFVRVDLYEISGRIYFSEITFSPCSGMVPFEPKEWDEKLGSWIRLPEKTSG